MSFDGYYLLYQTNLKRKLLHFVRLYIHCELQLEIENESVSKRFLLNQSCWDPWPSRLKEPDYITVGKQSNSLHQHQQETTLCKATESATDLRLFIYLRYRYRSYLRCIPCKPHETQILKILKMFTSLIHSFSLFIFNLIMVIQKWVHTIHENSIVKIILLILVFLLYWKDID